MQAQETKENQADGRSGELTLVFEPVTGGSHVEVERAPSTNLLQQVVNEVLQKLGVQQARNITVQKKDDGSLLDLGRTLEALGLKNGERLTLAWQVGGGKC
ncbi:MAG: hypothetical protein L0338_39110 [Acidobacteria bacterium]|nr:hypothetical protein [Acidobacteriota bacterium]